MHYLITGGTGLIGSKICQKLTADGHAITVLSRRRERVLRCCGPSVTAISHLNEIDNSEHIDTVINLAGAPIADARWTARRKQVLEQSRIQLTEALVNWLAEREQKPKQLISGSAIGWYGNQGKTVLNEKSGFKDDYAHQLCDKWEGAAMNAQAVGIRVCVVRTGLVIAPHAGFLHRLLLPFKLGLGGPIGNGEQVMSWVHLEDIASLFIFLGTQPELTGIFNGTAPHPVTNAEFSQILARQLHRPALITTPGWLLKPALGELSQLLLGGQHVLPEKACAAGFKFQYTVLESALADVLQ